MILATTLFLLFFTLYLACLCPSVYFLDAGELITAAYLLDIAHPPGHPIYTLAGKAFTFIPLGSIAFRLNLMSAVFAGMALLFLWGVWGAVVSKLMSNESPEHHTANTMCGILMVVLFSASYSFAIQAVRAEVYSLHVFLAGAFLYLLFQDHDRKHIPARSQTALLLVSSFLFGLGCANHHLVFLLLIPGAAFWIFSNHQKFKTLSGNFGVIVLFFILGLSSYLYLPIRSMTDPFIDWGNPEVWENFIASITGRQYQGSFHLITLGEMTVNAGKYIFLARENLGWWVITLGFIGFIYLLHKNLRVAGFILLLGGLGLASTYLQPSFNIFNPDVHGYLLISLLTIILCTGLGITFFIKWLPTKHYPWHRYVACGVYGGLVILCGIYVITHLPRYDKSRSYVTSDLIKAVIREIAPRSVVLTFGDGLRFPWLYFSRCERRREDVVMIERTTIFEAESLRLLTSKYPDIMSSTVRRDIEGSVQYIADEESSESSGAAEWNRIVAGNLPFRNVYWEPGSEGLASPHHSTPVGPVLQFTREPGVDPIPTMKRRWAKFLEQIKEGGILIHDVVAQRNLYVLQYNLGNHWRRAGNCHQAVEEYGRALSFYSQGKEGLANRGFCFISMGQHENAIRDFRTALDIDPEYDTAYYNLGMVFYLEGEFDRAREVWEIALGVLPKEVHQKYRRSLKLLDSL